MTAWLISADSKKYKCDEAFDNLKNVDWKQISKFEIDDIVYIYKATPIKQITFKTIVKGINIPFENKIDDKKYWVNYKDCTDHKDKKFVRLALVSKVDKEDSLSLDNLRAKKFLSNAPQKSQKINSEFEKFLDSFFYNDDYDSPEEITNETYIEGLAKTVKVNTYERSNIARKKCIEVMGTKCKICNFDFEKTYGKLGKDFIHIHHIIPISEIKKRIQN